MPTGSAEEFPPLRERDTAIRRTARVPGSFSSSVREKIVFFVLANFKLIDEPVQISARHAQADVRSPLCSSRHLRSVRRMSLRLNWRISSFVGTVERPLLHRSPLKISAS